ncbi:unnamed protein product [Dovyalis caffra]|uniref:Uncharacterized protein n=1 Tax=Dovyalis caffra TaxID=77055 RepID=A0AAV1RHV1_9ROSI|nr:unnamed protein product [Dovyalis caffra]
MLSNDLGVAPYMPDAWNSGFAKTNPAPYDCSIHGSKSNYHSHDHSVYGELVNMNSLIDLQMKGRRVGLHVGRTYRLACFFD